MTEYLKNLLIVSTVGDDGRVASVKMPVSGNTYTFQYDEKGNVVKVKNGRNVISEGIDTYAAAVSLYDEDDESVPAYLDIDLRSVNSKGKNFALDFSEEGRLEHEVNDTYEAYYFHKEWANYVKRVLPRLKAACTKAVAMVGEVKDANGDVYVIEVINGMILLRDKKVAEEAE